jgi:NADH dehydrogenase
MPATARIYKPAKTAMQSGTAKTHDWVLEFAPASAREVDPLMGWTSSSDTQAQVRLRFETKEAALAYAAEKGIDVIVQDPKERRPNLRPGGYGENFATNRRGAWTH